MQRWLVIGNHDQDEFSSSIQWLRMHVECTFWKTIDDLGHGDLGHGMALAPDIVLLLVGHRGQFAQSWTERIQSTLPLARLICVCGSWCEGEMRSGSPYVGWERIYAHQFVGKMLLEASQSGKTIAIPKTASSEEIWLNYPALQASVLDSTVAVVGHDNSIISAIAKACESFGFKTVRTRPNSELWMDSADFVIYDADRTAEKRSRGQRDLKSRFPCAEIVVLLDFPRIQERNQAHRDGASFVISKPFDVHELIAVLKSAETKGPKSAESDLFAGQNRLSPTKLRNIR